MKDYCLNKTLKIFTIEDFVEVRSLIGSYGFFGESEEEVRECIENCERSRLTSLHVISSEDTRLFGDNRGDHYSMFGVLS